MKILIDTNICLDILQNRSGLYNSSKDSLLLASDKRFKMFITTATVMDIMYITRKSFQNNSAQKKAVENFISEFKLLKILKKNINFGFSGTMKDFEDAVQVDCAKTHFVHLILTRNIKDFINSPVKAITPEDFLKQYQ